MNVISEVVFFARYDAVFIPLGLGDHAQRVAGYAEHVILVLGRLQREVEVPLRVIELAEVQAVHPDEGAELVDPRQRVFEAGYGVVDRAVQLVVVYQLAYGALAAVDLVGDVIGRVHEGGDVRRGVRHHGLGLVHDGLKREGCLAELSDKPRGLDLQVLGERVEVVYRVGECVAVVRGDLIEGGREAVELRHDGADAALIGCESSAQVLGDVFHVLDRLAEVLLQVLLVEVREEPHQVDRDVREVAHQVVYVGDLVRRGDVIAVSEDRGVRAPLDFEVFVPQQPGGAYVGRGIGIKFDAEHPFDTQSQLCAAVQQADLLDRPGVDARDLDAAFLVEPACVVKQHVKLVAAIFAERKVSDLERHQGQHRATTATANSPTARSARAPFIGSHPEP